MGNYASCALAGKQSRSAKVILPSGEVKQFYNPIKAAELMLEIPNHFVVNSKSMIVRRRLIALNADDDLEIHNAYVMFPMQRLNSVVTTSDMGAIFLVAKRSGAQVVPAFSGEAGSLPVVCEEKVELEGYFSPEFKHRMSVSRSKRPGLDTISE